MKKRVLITGGFGYLGGRIAVELGNESSLILRLGSRRQRSAPVRLPGIETVVMDVREPKTLVPAVEDVHTVVHLAAMNENDCVLDPGEAVLVNTLGTFNVLRSAINAGVERFIYLSTAHVYGSPLVGRIAEDNLPRPVHPYAITHLAAEHFVLAAHDLNSVVGIVVRLSNGFGSPTHPDVDRWTLLVNDLCRQVVQTRRLVMRSGGMQRRDFVTLHDIGRAMRFLIDLPSAVVGDGLFNLGGETSLSVREMVQRVTERCRVVLNYAPEVVWPEAVRSETDSDLVYCIERLKRTGFRLHGDIDSEIDDTLRLCSASFGLTKEQQRA
jgi:UDP-glucose 4-epimerase